jgi:hypothetical protein
MALDLDINASATGGRYDPELRDEVATATIASFKV